MPPKYQRIADELRIHIEAGKYVNSATLPTEFAIAQEYQVSRQTVRQALSVLAKDGLIEKRQGSGSHILRHTPVVQPEMPNRSIAVVITYISDYIFPSVLREAENVLSTHNCTPSLFATQNQVANERKVLKNLLNMPIDGILVEGTKTALPNPNLDLYQKLLDKGIPLVFMHGDYPQLLGARSVLDDNFGGGYQLAQYLLGKGHTKIAGIFKGDDIQGHGRFAGYAAGLRDAGLPVEDDHVFWYHTETKSRFITSPTENTPPELLAAVQGCTAVVCYNDEIANHLISLLLKNGIRVPQDVAVVSFDNSQYSELSPVPLTSLSHEPYNVGRIAAEKLLQLMDGEPCESELVPWTLIERKSG